jgi:hypothetical protein
VEKPLGRTRGELKRGSNHGPVARSRVTYLPGLIFPKNAASGSFRVPDNPTMSRKTPTGAKDAKPQGLKFFSLEMTFFGSFL